jgi:thiol-disulfide isomerase/thioredoxin
MTAIRRSHVRRVARYLVIFSGLLSWVPNGSAQKPGGAGPAPDIDLPTLAGGHVKLSSLKGHPVVVTFWGTWCPPCREEFPELVAAHKKYRDSGLVVLAVNQRDQELSNKAVEDFVKEFGAEFEVALDTHGRARRNYRLVGLPTMVFVDASGMIQGVHPGPISAAEIDRGLATILPTK